MSQAPEKEQQQEYKALIDQRVKRLIRIRQFWDEPEARDYAIWRLKQRGRLPADYTYPEEP